MPFVCVCAHVHHLTSTFALHHCTCKSSLLSPFPYLSPFLLPSLSPLLPIPPGIQGSDLKVELNKREEKIAQLEETTRSLEVGLDTSRWLPCQHILLEGAGEIEA